MAARNSSPQEQAESNNSETGSEENPDVNIDDPNGVSFDDIINICPDPPHVTDMEQIQDENSIFMISPFKFDPTHPEREPTSVYCQNNYGHRGDMNHVHMPCSPHNTTKDKKSVWSLICKSLIELKNMCDTDTATVENLTETIQNCIRHRCDMNSLEKLINEIYSIDERRHFMSTVLSNICSLALNVGLVCPQGVSFDDIINICPDPPHVTDMEQIQDENSIFMISPFKFDPTHPEREPTSVYCQNNYGHRGDMNHVHMPCSPHNTTKDKKSVWSLICKSLIELKNMCDTDTATVENLTETIQNCIRHRCDMNSLEKLINEIYSIDERRHFMSTVLSNICSLALNVGLVCPQPPPLLRTGSNRSVTMSQKQVLFIYFKIYSIDERRHFMSTVLSNICSLALNVGLVCPQPPPLLRTGSNRSVTMSQKQVASLLACSFFCLFPNRSYSKHRNKFSSFPHANFISLYKTGHPKNIEKLKCILHYFRRITEEMPNGVITIRRFSLPKQYLPLWHKSHTSLCDLHLTTSKKIEEVQNTLQADFANKYIGGGVLGSGCVQEEIRFSICPEMLVSLLVCEVMEDNECIFLIGCEQYSSYRGYANSFQFDGDYRDTTLKDTWGRKWCHLVAMDAIYFRDPSKQYNMKAIDRELIKAYTSFYPLGRGPNYEFGIATGNWGCGAFNGDRYLKAIIQWMAASEAKRPLIYAAYRNKNLVNSFNVVYEYLKDQKATVADLYQYIQRYLTQVERGTLFEYILNTPVSFLK
ncbi:unnamed protein product [Adineta steineri]|uniref:poly(ADP-ribose) glycohydrolase n=1 Tax=Adineta steineri TaxID=433720 RepID=A0A814DX62_9BILA|nr:unnamed protein product [Adineta steineri]